MDNWKPWDEYISPEAFMNGVDEFVIQFTERFGKYLAEDGEYQRTNKKGQPEKVSVPKLTTSQLRRFFGEVKRQQIIKYKEASFVMLKPKLAYAVGRAKNGRADGHAKIEDLYNVLSAAIDIVVEEERNRKRAAEAEQEKKDSERKASPFQNFIAIFESIVAYHKKYVIEKQV